MFRFLVVLRPLFIPLIYVASVILGLPLLLLILIHLFLFLFGLFVTFFIYSIDLCFGGRSLASMFTFDLHLLNFLLFTEGRCSELVVFRPSFVYSIHIWAVTDSFSSFTSHLNLLLYLHLFLLQLCYLLISP